MLSQLGVFAAWISFFSFLYLMFYVYMQPYGYEKHAPPLYPWTLLLTPSQMTPVFFISASCHRPCCMAGAGLWATCPPDHEKLWNTFLLRGANVVNRRTLDELCRQHKIKVSPVKMSCFVEKWIVQALIAGFPLETAAPNPTYKNPSIAGLFDYSSLLWQMVEPKVAANHLCPVFHGIYMVRKSSSPFVAMSQLMFLQNSGIP